METVLLVIDLMVILALIVLVLLQRSEGGGLGMGGGAGGGLVSVRGSANLLSRATKYLAVAFFTISLALAAISGQSRQPSSILDAAPAAPTAPAAPASQEQPAQPAVPLSN